MTTKGKNHDQNILIMQVLGIVVFLFAAKKGLDYSQEYFSVPENADFAVRVAAIAMPVVVGFLLLVEDFFSMRKKSRGATS